MCGIAGMIQCAGKAIAPGLMERMTDALAHRGPDGKGVYLDSHIGLGHRRLAIIDLSEAGHQPMATGDGTYILSYNGEVYNFREIRRELEGLGHRFRSKTDSEVVLAAYVQWGAECLHRFNGMFAFAIYDRKRRELFIARDRYGIKPLYYAFQGSWFLFGSEQKAILAHPEFRRTINEESLLEYLTFQNLFTDKTLLKDVRMFPAGCWARISTDNPGNNLTVVRYWDYDFKEPAKFHAEKDYFEELDRLFRQAVTRQLVSDVEVGSYLSGGMDSGSITAVAATELPYIKTFTCGFDMNSISGLELSFDEREKAEYMSYLFKTEHYEMVLKAGDMERIMPGIAWCLEEPRVGQSYPNYYAAQLASKFVKVVLSGTGGDEMFGGYPWRYYRAVVNADFEEYIDTYYSFWQRLIPDHEIANITRPIADSISHVRTRDIFRNVFLERGERLSSPEEYINHSLYFEAKTFLHGLLMVEDKLSMAHGLETRVPFLDNDLVDFAMTIPVELKLKNLTEVIRMNENEPGYKTENYFQKTRDGKLLLRRVMEHLIPPEITNAVKQGFSAPDASWFRGESIDYVRNMFFNKHARIYEYLDRNVTQRLVNEHLEGKENRRLFIWSLLNIEWWLRTYLT